MEGQEANENSFKIGQDTADAAEFGAGLPGEDGGVTQRLLLGPPSQYRALKQKPRSLCPFPPRPGWDFCLLCRPVENINPTPSACSSFKK